MLNLIARRVDCELLLHRASRRCSYQVDVQQNIKTVSSLLQVAREKYTASQILRDPEESHDGRLPLTEIHEELDDDGNVICRSHFTMSLVSSLS